MSRASDKSIGKFNRWTWLIVGLVVVLLPFVGLVGYVSYEQYGHERERDRLSAHYTNFSLAMLPGHLPAPTHGRFGLEKPVSDGEVVLLRKGEAFAAFIPIGQGASGTVSFEWYYRTDGSGRLDDEGGAVTSGGGTLTGSQPTVSFGPFALKWSLCQSGWGWLYYSRGDLESVTPTDQRVCPTTFRNIEDLDARNNNFVYRASRSDVGITGSEVCESTE